MSAIFVYIFSQHCAIEMHTSFRGVTRVSKISLWTIVAYLILLSKCSQLYCNYLYVYFSVMYIRSVFFNIRSVFFFLASYYFFPIRRPLFVASTMQPCSLRCLCYHIACITSMKRTKRHRALRLRYRLQYVSMSHSIFFNNNVNMCLKRCKSRSCLAKRGLVV